MEEVKDTQINDQMIGSDELGTCCSSIADEMIRASGTDFKVETTLVELSEDL